jgi:Zn-dependent protease
MNRQSSIHLFRFRGIDVFLHWSWFLVAIFEIQGGFNVYSSRVWNALEYMGLFLIVLLHEFGHALACRQVGGNANRIVLWPLGGVAYVDPPPRPGATLWSIVAGPLVNVALAPILYILLISALAAGWRESLPDVYLFLRALWRTDIGLFVFNMLPIYPLDGGQIFRSLLWFVVGRARSLIAATVIGFLGVAGFIGLAVWMRSLWFGALAVFMLLNCWGGLKHALALSRLAKLPRREGYACPWCKTAPPLGNFWKCGQCGTAFDTFATQAACPQCRAQFPVTRCVDCGKPHPINDWMTAAVASSVSHQGSFDLSS